MQLNPVDVREVEFVLARRGYDEKQVDDFLDRVVEALEERDAALAAATAAPPTAAQAPSGSVVDLFAMAQRTAEEHVAAAEAAAEELLTQARHEATQTVATAQREAARLRAAAHVEQAAELEELSRERDLLERRLTELQQLLGSTRAELETYLGRVFDAVRRADGDAPGPHAVQLSA